MASTTTTKLGLVKPTPGTNEPVNRSTMNADYDKIDAGMGAVNCTSGTRPASPWNDMLIYETDTGLYRIRSGGAWVTVGRTDTVLNGLFAPYPKGLLKTVTRTADTSTATSGTTETRDAVLGDYQYTAPANRRIRVTIEGELEISVTERVRAQVRVRDSGTASTPTTASTQVIDHAVELTTAGSTGRVGFTFSSTYNPAAGVHTLSLFLLRNSGASALITAVGERQLYVEDIGNNTVP